MARELPQAPPGSDYPCPNCGHNGPDTWRVWYTVPSSQDAGVVIGEDGRPEVVDYYGCDDSGDGDNGDTEIVCRHCDHEIDLWSDAEKATRAALELLDAVGGSLADANTVLREARRERAARHAKATRDLLARNARNLAALEAEGRATDSDMDT